MNSIRKISKNPMVFTSSIKAFPLSCNLFFLGVDLSHMSQPKLTLRLVELFVQNDATEC